MTSSHTYGATYQKMLLSLLILNVSITILV